MVLIEWHDARFYPNIYKMDEIEEHKMVVFKSLGYLIRKDTVTTVIGAEQSNEGNYRDITLIPTGSIVSIKELTTVDFV